MAASVCLRIGQNDCGLESDSSRELRTASERVVTFGSERGTSAYRTQGCFCLIRDAPPQRTRGADPYAGGNVQYSPPDQTRARSLAASTRRSSLQFEARGLLIAHLLTQRTAGKLSVQEVRDSARAPRCRRTNGVAVVSCRPARRPGPPAVPAHRCRPRCVCCGARQRGWRVASTPYHG